MAGAEDNTNILEGMNQVIKAVNDLVLTSTTTLNCGGCGTDPPSEPGEEGEEPPPGWAETDDPPGEAGYQTRKCKVANLTHESMLEWMVLWQTYNVDDYVAGSLTVLVVLLGTLVGLLAFPVLGAVIGSILGFYGGLALIIIAGGFDLDALVSLMGANEEDLVCALYVSTDAGSAKADYISVLQTAGASAGDIALLEAAIAIDAMNLLFFKKEVGQGAIEAALDGYTGPVDCGDCAPCLELYTVFGTYTGTYPTYSQIDSENDGTCERVTFYINWNGLASCGLEAQMAASGGPPGGAPSCGTSRIFYATDDALNVYGDIPNGQLSQITGVCVRYVNITHASTFSLTSVSFNEVPC